MESLNRNRKLALAIIVVATILPSRDASAQTFSVIHNFIGGTDGSEPNYGLTIDGNGNLYGTTFDGTSPNGNVYELTHSGSSWTLHSLFNFNGLTLPGNGAVPYATVIFGPDGSLYGTTGFGGGQGTMLCDSYGALGCGTVFNLRGGLGSTWTESVLHSFSGGSDGGEPYGGTLIFDHAGNLYGTTYAGGGGTCTLGCGVVYELTPSGGGWTENVLYAFTNGMDGASPWAGVTMDGSGNLYSTASAGGQNGYGTVYELVKSGSSWTEKTLYSFQNTTDGRKPYAGLIFDAAGNLYGGTQYGGTNNGGTAFELTPTGASWTFKTIYSFTGAAGEISAGPLGNLVMDGAGNLYGSTAGGGAHNDGTVFKLTPGSPQWGYTLLQDFSYTDGASPRSNLVFDSSGNLYGTASAGGSGIKQNCNNACGVVFEITP
jgi:uncharacterized repeat protein (TIGR03803 family)